MVRCWSACDACKALTIPSQVLTDKQRSQLVRVHVCVWMFAVASGTIAATLLAASAVKAITAEPLTGHGHRGAAPVALAVWGFGCSNCVWLRVNSARVMWGVLERE